MSEINFHLGDCMDFMRGKPDNYYDLAVVDPPYGGGGKEERPFQEAQAASDGFLADTEPDNGDTRNTRGRFARYKCTRTGGTWASKYSFREPAQKPDCGMGGEIQNYPPLKDLRRNRRRTSSSGTSPLRRNTSTSFSGYRRTR